MFDGEKFRLLLQVVDGCVADGLGRVVLGNPFGDLACGARAAHLRTAHAATHATACDVVADEALGNVNLEFVKRGRGVRSIKAANGHDGELACQLVARGILRIRGRCHPAIATGILREQLDQALVGGTAAEQAGAAAGRGAIATGVLAVIGGCIAAAGVAIVGRACATVRSSIAARATVCGAIAARTTAHAASAGAAAHVAARSGSDD